MRSAGRNPVSLLEDRLLTPTARARLLSTRVIWLFLKVTEKSFRTLKPSAVDESSRSSNKVLHQTGKTFFWGAGKQGHWRRTTPGMSGVADESAGPAGGGSPLELPSAPADVQDGQLHGRQGTSVTPSIGSTSNL